MRHMPEEADGARTDEPLRVIVADDDPLARRVVRDALEAGGIVVIAEAANGREAVELCLYYKPDVVLMDLVMPDVDGIQATRHVLETVTDPPRIIVVTTFENDDYVYAALRAGASGFLLKRARPDDLVQAIRIVAHGDILLFPAAIRKLAAGHATAGRGAGARPRGSDSPVASLSDREAEVLRLMATGLSNAEIAARLHVSAETVKTHVSNVLTKLNVRDRTQAVIAAYESAFIIPD